MNRPTGTRIYKDEDGYITRDINGLRYWSYHHNGDIELAADGLLGSSLIPVLQARMYRLTIDRLQEKTEEGGTPSS